MPRIPLLLALLGLCMLGGCAGDADSMPRFPFAGDSGVLIDAPVDATLTGPRSTVSVPASAVAAAKLETAGGERLGLYLEDLAFGRPGVYFEVYANLPPGVEPDPSGAHYVGNLGHFGPAGQVTDVGFDVTDVLSRLTREGDGLESLTLTFVRRGLEGEDVEGLAADPADAVRFSGVRVVREPGPRGAEAPR
jgi:hypothetical protein